MPKGVYIREEGKQRGQRIKREIRTCLCGCNTFECKVNSQRRHFSNGCANIGRKLTIVHKSKFSFSGHKHTKDSNLKNRVSHLKENTPKERLMKMSLSASKRIAEQMSTREGFYDTSLELEMKRILTELKEEFIHPYYVRDIEHAYSADFYLPGIHCIIETDGKYRHNFPIGSKIDHIRTAEMKEAGYKVLRFWGTRKNDYDFDLYSVKEAICLEKSTNL